jgi:alpha-1,3-rhamnosyl/mannosyltransferase
MVTNRGPIINWGFRKTHVVHDTIGLHQKRWKGGILKAFLSSTYNRLTIPLSARLADRIITVSNFSKELILKDLKIPETKICVIYNGVEESFFRPDPTSIKKFGLRENGFIFHLGFLEPRKNTRRVIEAYARINPKLRDQFPLVIAGLSERAKGVFLPLIGNLNLERNTIFLPYVSDKELAGLYCSCAVFVWPSLWEGFGLPVVEAMAAGAPVITSKTTSLPEVAGNAALLVDPENVVEIRDAIVLLLESQNLRCELSRKGIGRARTFQWSKTVKDTVKVWREVLNF